MRRKDQLKNIFYALIDNNMSEIEKIEEIKRIVNKTPKKVQIPKEPSKFKYTIDEIIKQTIEYSGYTKNQLFIEKRIERIVIYRQLAHYKAFLLASKNKSDIGRLIGNKKHSTVISSIKRIKDLLETDKLFRIKHAEFLEL